MSETKRSLGLSLRRNIFSLRTLTSFAIAIAFVVFLATTFEVDWFRTWDNVQSLNPWLYAAAILVYYTTFAFRGLRWKILAYNAGMGNGPVTGLPSVFQFGQLILIGWFVNGIAPLRLGDAYRAHALSERSGGGFSWSLGTIVAERFVDMLTVLLLAVVAVLWYSATRDIGAIAYVVMAAAGLAALMAALLMVMRGYGARVAQHFPGRLEGAYIRFHEGTLGSLRQRRRRAIFVLGLVGWLLEVARLYIVVEALDLSIAIPLAMLVALGHAILSTVPSPGGVGAVEAGLIGLLVLELERADAVSVVLVDRTITYVSVVVLGGLVLLVARIVRARSRPRYRPDALPEHRTAQGT
jgi:uncharacterized protein (TIRG00374 family)